MSPVGSNQQAVFRIFWHLPRNSFFFYPLSPFSRVSTDFSASSCVWLILRLAVSWVGEIIQLVFIQRLIVHMQEPVGQTKTGDSCNTVIPYKNLLLRFRGVFGARTQSSSFTIRLLTILS